MATTSSTLAAGTATSGGSRKNGTGGRFGLRARVAASVATFGCAAALAIGGLGASDTNPTHAQLAPAAPLIRASTTITDEQRRFLEWNTQLPDGGAAPRLDWATIQFIEQNELPIGASAATTITDEQRRFLEWNTQLPDGGAAPRLDWATIRLIEQNRLPETAPVVGPGLVPPGPADEYTQGDSGTGPAGAHGAGPADEYTQADGAGQVAP